MKVSILRSNRAAFIMLFLFSAVGLFIIGQLRIHSAHAASVEVVSGNTAVAENDKGGWLFNRDPDNVTPYQFDRVQKQVGDGAVHILPIGANPADKFIAEYFVQERIADVESISYDFKVGPGGDEATDANEFYMNVYTNFDDSLNYYQCKYDVVPTSAAGWTTVTFDPTLTYPVTQRGTVPEPCPSSPADMGPDATIRMIALNVGDTAATDEGLDGFYDNVVVTTTSDMKTFDFDPYPVKGEITSPTANEVVRYSVQLAASYDDGDDENDDAVQWAVRQGTCAAGTNTVAGNVDGFSDVAVWDGAQFVYDLDTSAFADGEYCFIFNPRDDVGQADVRETVSFIVNNVPAPDACTGIYDHVYTVTKKGSSVRTTNDNDLVIVETKNASIRAEDGDDCIVVRGKNNVIRAGAGSDIVVVESGKDNDIRGDDGDDIIYAGSHASVWGNAGDDYIEAGKLSKLWGNDGYDTCKVDVAKSFVRSCEVIL